MYTHSPKPSQMMKNTASPAKCEDVLSQFRAILQKGLQEEAPKNSFAFCIYLKVLLSELETQVLISQRLKYLQDISATIASITQASAQLGGLIKHLKNR